MLLVWTTALFRVWYWLFVIQNICVNWDSALLFVACSPINMNSSLISNAGLCLFSNLYIMNIFNELLYVRKSPSATLWSKTGFLPFRLMKIENAHSEVLAEKQWRQREVLWWQRMVCPASWVLNCCLSWHPEWGGLCAKYQKPLHPIDNLTDRASCYSADCKSMPHFTPLVATQGLLSLHASVLHHFPFFGPAVLNRDTSIQYNSW